MNASAMTAAAVGSVTPDSAKSRADDRSQNVWTTVLSTKLIWFWAPEVSQVSTVRTATGINGDDGAVDSNAVIWLDAAVRWLSNSDE